MKFTFNVRHFEVAQCGVELYHGVVVGDELIHYPTQPRYSQLKERQSHGEIRPIILFNFK